jgi:hypothetical protein
MPASRLDFQKLYGDKIEQNLANAVTVEFTLPDGSKWHATNTASHAALLALSDGSAPTQYLWQLVVPEEQGAFSAALLGMRGLDETILIEMINAITEALAGVPTSLPSSSPPTSPSRTSGGRSTARSSSVARHKG